MSKLLRSQYSLFVAVVIGFLCLSCANNTGEGKGAIARLEQDSGHYKTSEPKLEPVYKAASSLGLLRSYLVWKDDQLIGEGYFQSYRDSLDHLRSGTKSVMSILIGIAIDKQIIADVDDPIKKYIEPIVGSYSDQKQQITIKDLLTMTAGFQWTENGGIGFNQWVSSSDPIRYVLDKRIVDKPGSTFNYNSAGVHLLSVLLTEASGMSTLDFAKRHLFEPLGINKYRWNRLRKGYYNGGAGLELQPKDFLRIGVMMQNQGVYNGQRIVSREWVSESTQAYTYAPDGLDGYGYLWWIAHQDHHHVYTAMGFGGQYLVVHPELKSVIAITSQWRNTNGRMDSYMQDLKEVMIMNLKALDSTK